MFKKISLFKFYLIIQQYFIVTIVNSNLVTKTIYSSYAKCLNSFYIYSFLRISTLTFFENSAWGANEKIKINSYILMYSGKEKKARATSRVGLIGTSQIRKQLYSYTNTVYTLTIQYYKPHFKFTKQQKPIWTTSIKNCRIPWTE